MLKIEKFKQQDISTLLIWLEGTDNRFLYLFAGPKYQFPLTEQQLLETIESDEILPFKFMDSETGEILGHCQIMRIDFQQHSASLGRILINPDCRGRGLGARMLNEITGYAKKVLNLKKLSLRVYDFNQTAIKCYKNIGFIETGTEFLEMEAFDEVWKCISMEYTI